MRNYAMRPDFDLQSQARLVSPLAARQYAAAKGWQPVVEGLRSRIYLFRHPTERLRQLMIPMDQGYGDYAVAVLDVAERLAEIENRPISSVLTDLIMPGADVLRFRLISPRPENGSISLEAALNLLEGAKTALLSAAHSVEHPQTHHPRLNRIEGKELLRASRFGQTEVGSFVIKIVCPLAAVDVPPALDLIEPNAGQLPFVRRTTNLLMRSVGRVVTAVEQNTVENLIG